VEKKITAELLTEYEPTLAWNQWIREPTESDPGEERPKPDRLRVEIAWPTIEDSSRYADAGSTNAMSLEYAKRCIKSIINPGVAGIDATDGYSLLAIRSKGKRKAWQLAIHVGSYIFSESFLTGEEEKN